MLDSSDTELSCFGLICAVDTSSGSHGFASYSEFRKSRRGIMFCAAKHREGSDIPFLSMAVFVDGVCRRSATTFVQCIGRVLRLKENNSHGVILDLCARSGLDLCERVGEYLGVPGGKLPWLYKRVGKTNFLTMADCPQPPTSPVITPDLVSLFVRKCPTDPRYSTRLEQELSLIRDKNVSCALVRAIFVRVQRYCNCNYS